MAEQDRTPDAPREPQPCQYGVDHDQNICGRTPTKLFRWSGERYAWRCELHEPTRYPPTDAVLVDAPREPVGRDADLEALLEQVGYTSLSAAEDIAALAREARDAAQSWADAGAGAAIQRDENYRLLCQAHDERDALVAELRALRAAARRYLQATQSYGGWDNQDRSDRRKALEALAGEPQP